MRRPNTWWALIATAVLGLGLTGCGGGATEDESADTAEAASTEVAEDTSPAEEADAAPAAEVAETPPAESAPAAPKSEADELLALSNAPSPPENSETSPAASPLPGSAAGARALVARAGNASQEATEGGAAGGKRFAIAADAGASPGVMPAGYPGAAGEGQNSPVVVSSGSAAAAGAGGMPAGYPGAAGGGTNSPIVASSGSAAAAGAGGMPAGYPGGNGSGGPSGYPGAAAGGGMPAGYPGAATGGSGRGGAGAVGIGEAGVGPGTRGEIPGGLGGAGADKAGDFKTAKSGAESFLAALKAKNTQLLADATAKRAEYESSQAHREGFIALLSQTADSATLDQLARNFDGMKVMDVNNRKSSGVIEVIVGKDDTKRSNRSTRRLIMRKEKDGWKVMDFTGLRETNPDKRGK